jgi:hypothetical protein
MYHCLDVQPSMQLENILDASKFCQLWIKLLQTFGSRFTCGYKFSMCFGKYQGTPLLHHMVKLPNYLLKWLYHLDPHQQSQVSFSCFISLPVFGGVSVMDFGHSSRSVVAYHFNLQFPNDIMMLNTFSYAYLSSEYLLWWGSFQVFYLLIN